MVNTQPVINNFQEGFQEGLTLLQETIKKLIDLGYEKVDYTYKIDELDNVIGKENYCVWFEKEIENGEKIQVVIKYKLYSVDDYTNYYGETKEGWELDNSTTDDNRLPDIAKYAEKVVNNIISGIKNENQLSETTTAGKRKTKKRRTQHKSRK